MSASLSVGDDGKLQRHRLKRRGHFAGQEIVDAKRKHLEPAELQAFFKQIPTKSFWYPYFYLQYVFGCRLSEPALILEEDVSFEQKQIIIKRLKKNSEKEDGGYAEHVYMADERVLSVVNTALDWKRKMREVENPFLFPARRKVAQPGAERLSQLRHLDGHSAISRFTAHRAFQDAAKRASIPEKLCHSHVLRHTRATLLLASGVPAEQVQFLLGHSSLKMTQRYIGVADSMRTKLNAGFLQQGLGL